MADTRRASTTETNGRLRSAVSRIAEDAAELSGAARRALGETAHKAGEMAQDIADEAVTQSRRVARAAVHEVREHPARSIAIGAAVGILIAAWLTRRR
jgi:ElaB/YqjD/DUF883 family membrane-anchored ribosome-binding protein